LKKKTLILDLDETLIHSFFKKVKSDFVATVKNSETGKVNDIYVMKRPGVDMFLRRLASIYELVIFTASLSKYADAIINILDEHRYC
jgi:carboxy-terminal domain RNA polymerase II polypeptide A small phosphatase